MFTVLQEPISPEDVHHLLATVPEWFGRPESNREYVRATQNLPCWVARTGHRAIGVLAVQKHSATSWEIHVMVVDRQFHRHGVGRALIQQVEEEARKAKVSLLQVKTLGASHSDPFYRDTRYFYQAQGFIPLEETDLWGEDTPCLIMVKPLVGF